MSTPARSCRPGYLRRPRKEGYQELPVSRLALQRRTAARSLSSVLNQTPFRAARILVADRNFGGGSSREQAPWSLVDYGIRCVIAADFGDPLLRQLAAQRLLPSAARLRCLHAVAAGAACAAGAPRCASICAEQSVTGPDGTVYAFQIDAFRKRCLLEGLDEIGLTLQSEPAISAFEAAYRQKFDWLFKPSN